MSFILEIVLACSLKKEYEEGKSPKLSKRRKRLSKGSSEKKEKADMKENNVSNSIIPHLLNGISPGLFYCGH